MACVYRKGRSACCTDSLRGRFFFIQQHIMLQLVTLADGRKACAVVLPDLEKLSEIAPLKSAIFYATKNLAQNPDFCGSSDLVELLNLLECMEIDPETL